MRSFLRGLLPQARHGEIEPCPDEAALMDLAYSGSHASGKNAARAAGTLRHVMGCNTCATEWKEILTDRAAARETTPPPAPTLTLDRRCLRFLSGWVSVLLPAFRSDGGAAIVDSRIVPWGRDYVILEVRGEEEGVEVRLHKGEKNGRGPRISLYRDGQAVEVFHLQKTRHWQIGSFLPGHYSLLLGKKNILAFRIINESKSGYKGRSQHSSH